MKKRSITLIVLLLLMWSIFVHAQDCDILVQLRPVPGTDQFVYATHSYTMSTQMGTVSVTALTAENVVALVFDFARPRKICLDEKSNIHVRFTNGDDIAMVNAAGKNCNGKFALYFGNGLGNVGLLHFFRTNKIRFVRVLLQNGRWLKINFVDAMAYNLKRSLDCLASRIGAEIPQAPELSARAIDLTDSLQTPGAFTRAQFVGGDDELRTFLGKNMRTLSIVDRGVVIVSFLVDSNGEVHDPKVTSGVNEKLDAEARRLVSIMPKWRPALKNGIAVSMRTKIHIPF
jgi:Gram-negative bacterial TonB protein C-terminal